MVRREQDICVWYIHHSYLPNTIVYLICSAEEVSKGFVWASVNRDFKHLIYLSLSCERPSLFYPHIFILTPAQVQELKLLLIEMQQIYKLLLLFLPPFIPLVMPHRLRNIRMVLLSIFGVPANARRDFSLPGLMRHEKGSCAGNSTHNNDVGCVLCTLVRLCTWVISHSIQCLICFSRIRLCFMLSMTQSQ